MIAAVLAAVPFVGVSLVPVSAAGPTTIATSAAAKAFQHSAQDKVAYLHDGSLLVGYWGGANEAIIDHITSPLTTPVSTQVETVSFGSEITFYTLPSTNSTENGLGVLLGRGLVGVAVILASLALLVVHRALSTRTAAGRDVMQHSLGFRLYMTTAEKYRQQFAEKA